jgi:hypothetical protein
MSIHQLAEEAQRVVELLSGVLRPDKVLMSDLDLTAAFRLLGQVAKGVVVKIGDQLTQDQILGINENAQRMLMLARPRGLPPRAAICRWDADDPEAARGDTRTPQCRCDGQRGGACARK